MSRVVGRVALLWTEVEDLIGLAIARTWLPRTAPSKHTALRPYCQQTSLLSSFWWFRRSWTASEMRSRLVSRPLWRYSRTTSRSSSYSSLSAMSFDFKLMSLPTPPVSRRECPCSANRRTRSRAPKLSSKMSQRAERACRRTLSSLSARHSTPEQSSSTTAQQISSSSQTTPSSSRSIASALLSARTTTLEAIYVASLSLLPVSTVRHSTARLLKRCLVPHSSEVVNLILYVSIYDLNPSGHNLSLDLIGEVLQALQIYGLSLDAPLQPGKPLREIIMTLSHQDPLPAFAMLASANCEALATEVSSSCLATPLYCLTDQLCTVMGPGMFVPCSTRTGNNAWTTSLPSETRVSTFRPDGAAQGTPEDDPGIAPSYCFL